MNHSWQPDGDQRRRERFWNTAPPDPVKLAKQAGMPHYNRPLGQVLMPQSSMPIGPHAGKIMSEVPAEWLAWVNTQPWSANWHHWQPVRDYIERHPIGIMDPADLTQPDPVHIWPTGGVIYVTELYDCPPTEDWKWPQFAELTCHRDHEDKLHAFAEGALGLRPVWFQARAGERRHYRLTWQRRLDALRAGATELPRNRREQAQYFQRLREDGSTTCTKKCFATKKDAETSINRRLEPARGFRRNTPVYLRAYECPRCGFWHLTRQP